MYIQIDTDTDNDEKQYFLHTG